MPSALETLVKILKLEQETGYRNTAVIGGLGAFAANWQRDAHQQARRPEHHQLIEELVKLLRAYDGETVPAARAEAIQYMLGRITGRIPAPQVIDAPPHARFPKSLAGRRFPADQEMADFTPAEEETLAETAAPPAQASGTPATCRRAIAPCPSSSPASPRISLARTGCRTSGGLANSCGQVAQGGRQDGGEIGTAGDRHSGRSAVHLSPPLQRLLPDAPPQPSASWRDRQHRGRNRVYRPQARARGDGPTCM